MQINELLDGWTQMGDAISEIIAPTGLNNILDALGEGSEGWKLENAGDGECGLTG